MLYANSSPQPPPQLSGTKIPRMLALHRRASSERLVAQRVCPSQRNCLTQPLDPLARALSRYHPSTHQLTHSHCPTSFPLLPPVQYPPADSLSCHSCVSWFPPPASFVSSVTSCSNPAPS